MSRGKTDLLSLKSSETDVDSARNCVATTLFQGAFNEQDVPDYGGAG